MRTYVRSFSLILGLVLALRLVAAPAQAAPPRQSTGQTAFVPFSGSATLSYTDTPQVAPAAATADLLQSQQTETFAVQDPTHWRIDIQVTDPPLDSTTETVVANGSSLVAYDSRFDHAYQLPHAAMQSAPLLSIFLGESGVPPETTADQYRALLKRVPGEKVRVLGQTEVLGRPADVLEISPYARVSTGSCNGPKDCAKKSKGYGAETIWLDHQYGVVLRSQVHGVPKKIGGPQHFRYAVTSIEYGTGPSAADLAYVPPVSTEKLPANGGVSSGESSSGGGAADTLQAPPGFIAIKSPPGMTLSGSGSGDDWPSNGPSYAEGLFRGDPSQGFVYVEERIRAAGLPATLTAGSPETAGSCSVWTGTFPDGLHWLATQRGTISVLAVADKLSPDQLVQYAARGICAAPLVPLPSAQQVRDTALDNLRTEIDITWQILGWVVASAPSASDKTTLRTYERRLKSFDRAVFRLRTHNHDATYGPPSFPPPQKESFKDAVAGLKDEISVAKYQLAAAESAMRTVKDRQTLIHKGKIFDDLLRTVTDMASG